MKKIFFTLAFLAGFVAATKAQYIDKSAVPDVVNKSFASSYASVTKDAWQKDGKKFTVSFKSDTVSHILTFDDAGKTVYHQYSVPVGAVPKPVLDGGSKAFPDLQLAASDKIEENGKVSYLLAYKNGDSPVKVQLSEKGMVIKTFDSENQ